jgi:transcriptional regulator with XRE-family HTH domain
MLDNIDASRLIDFRVRKEITQRQVAERLQIATNTVSRWEQSAFRSIKLCDLIELIKYYKAYGLEEDDYTKITSTHKSRQQATGKAW